MKPSFTELRERLLVQKKVFADDDFGGLVETFEDHKDVWAKIDFASSKDITSRPLKDLLKGTSSLRKSMYKVTLRVDETLPEQIRFLRSEKVLQVISHPIITESYMMLFAVEL